MIRSEIPIYKITFWNKEEAVELHARQIYQSDLWGFLEVEELIFTDLMQKNNEKEKLLQGMFKNVSRIFIPIHTIIRIDEIEKPGVDIRPDPSFEKVICFSKIKK